jgi:hypothetical protein
MPKRRTTPEINRPLLTGKAVNAASGVLVNPTAQGDKVAEGPGIDIVPNGATKTIGLGGDLPLLYNADHTPVSEYGSIAAACAAAASGDAVELPPGTYTENITIPAGVTVRGRGRATVIAGTVTGGDGAAMQGVRVRIDGDDAGLLYGVYAGASGTFTLEDCEVLVDNATGDATALYSGDAGEIVARRCLLRGVSVGGDGWAAYRGPSGGAGELDHCILQYTTAPVEEAT